MTVHLESPYFFQAVLDVSIITVEVEGMAVALPTL